MAHYEGKKKNNRSNWRKERALQMGDEAYREYIESGNKSDIPTPTEEDVRQAMQAFTGARHLDCAPTHIQEAIARAKSGQHMNIQKPE